MIARFYITISAADCIVLSSLENPNIIHFEWGKGPKVGEGGFESPIENVVGGRACFRNRQMIRI